MVGVGWLRCRCPRSKPPTPTVKTTVDEVLLDLIVRDKKGKPVTDLKTEDITVLDNDVKQTLTSFRLVSGSDAVASSGAHTSLDPLRQIRVVTLAFDSMPEVDQRKLARTAAIDLIKGDQGTNVYYAVVVINTQLYVLQQFTQGQGRAHQGHRTRHWRDRRPRVCLRVRCDPDRTEAQSGGAERRRSAR